MFIEMIVEFMTPCRLSFCLPWPGNAQDAPPFSVEQEHDVKADLKRIQPHVVALSAKTGGFPITLRKYALGQTEQSQHYRNVGGPHCTFDQSLIEYDEVDVVVAGEADDAWVEILQRIQSNRSYDEVPNVFTKSNWASRFKNATQMERTRHLSNRITDLDRLPFLDREIVYTRVPHIAKFPMRSFMTSRGCPYQCTYCFEPKFNEIYRGKGLPYQRYSPERVVDELRYTIERYPSEFIKFYGDS